MPVLNLFCPHYRCPTISQIPVSWLQQEAVETIILDVDNTLLPWDENIPSDENIAWVEKVKKAGISIILASNNGGQRLDYIAHSLKLPYVAWAIKPFSVGFKRAMKKLKLKANDHILVIGDQIMTDVLGAKKLGLRVLWVESLSRKEFMATQVTRKFEKVLINKMIERGILPEGNNI